MIVVQTPLRLSLFGGGTDFEDFYGTNGGAVLSTAIDKSVFVIIKERFDDLICVNYSQREAVSSLDQLNHGLVREAMRLTGITKGVEITTLADIPSEGTGLGSSSSITVGLLQCMYSYQGKLVTAETLAQEACKIEIDVLKKPIGRQDQYIAAYGNLRLLTFDEGGAHVQNVNLDHEQKRQLKARLLIFYTGITRKADSILVEQQANIPNKIDVLKAMTALAYTSCRLLEAGEFDQVGQLFHEAWLMKKRLATGITNPIIDHIYETAIKAGALGGKVTGAGGGGFFLVWCPPDKQDNVRQALKHLRELPFNFEDDGSKVIFNYRRGA